MAIHRFTLLLLVVVVIGIFSSSCSQVFPSPLFSRTLSILNLAIQIRKRSVSSFFRACVSGRFVLPVKPSQDRIILLVVLDGSCNAANSNWAHESLVLKLLSLFFSGCSYKFTNINLLRRALTHASFSQENNKALSIFGTHIVETSVSLQFLTKDIDISSKALNHLIAQVSNVDSSCALDGDRLGLGKIIRVSPKTDATNSAILCAGFRAIFGAIAIDAGMVDEAVKVFWKVHGDRAGKLVSML